MDDPQAAADASTTPSAPPQDQTESASGNNDQKETAPGDKGTEGTEDNAEESVTKSESNVGTETGKEAAVEEKPSAGQDSAEGEKMESTKTDQEESGTKRAADDENMTPSNKKAKTDDPQDENAAAKEDEGWVVVSNEDVEEEEEGATKASWFGVPSDTLCDVCFLIESKNNAGRFMKCTGCKLVVHEMCYLPNNCTIVPKDAKGPRLFLCDVCAARKSGETPQKKATPKKKRTPRKVMSPGPLASTVEAKSDGRVYEHVEGDDMDVFCKLCLRRDVAGGMKPTDEGAWVHLACTMSSFHAYLKDGFVTGVPKTLARAKSRVKGLEKALGKTISCEACGVPGGLLIRCAEETKDEGENRACIAHLHPLCAEIVDRVRVVKVVGNGDVIQYKCEKHSYVGLDKCGKCRSASRQAEMLECDGCRKGYHMDCLEPALVSVPEDDWFCPKCVKKKEAKAPEEPAVKDPAATEPAATEATATEPAATEATASEPTATEAAASEPTAMETAASEPTAMETAASEPTEMEATASEPAAMEATSTEPAAMEPAASEPAGTEQAATEPAATEPIGEDGNNN